MHAANLAGKSDSHISYAADGHGLHRDAWPAFEALRSDAQAAGFKLAIVSGFRDFERQRAIWNAKACGQRELLDSHGRVLHWETLAPAELMYAILRWSALPGASRHHWGTDCDIYDAGATGSSYRVSLTPEEAAPGGIFAALHQWLDAQIAANNSHGFFRPYPRETNGIAPEAWHLSYAPIAAHCEKLWTPGAILDCVQCSDIKLKELVIEQFENIYPRFVRVEAGLYPIGYQNLIA